MMNELSSVPVITTTHIQFNVSDLVYMMMPNLRTTRNMNNPAGSKYKYIQDVNSYASDKVYMTCHTLYRTQLEGVDGVT